MAGLSGLGMAVDFMSDYENRKQQKQINTENHWHDERMFALQNQTEYRNWQRNNDYNDPSAQQARLKKAGLNPHLIYGTGTAANTSQQARTGHANNTPAVAPQIRFSAQKGIENIIAAQQAGLQTDNLKKQNDLLDATIAGKDIENRRAEFDLDFNKSINSYRQEGARLDIEGRRQSIGIEQAQQWLREVDTQIKQDYLTLEKELQKGKLINQTYSNKKLFQEYLHEQLKKSKTVEETNLLKQSINNAKWDSKLKQAEFKLKKYGLSPNDPSYLKLTAASLSLNDEDFNQLMIAAGLIQIGSTVGRFVPKANLAKPKPQMSNGYPVQKFNPKFYDK